MKKGPGLNSPANEKNHLREDFSSLNASTLNGLEDADQFDFAFREHGIRVFSLRPSISSRN